MSKVECFMPLESSDKWDALVYFFNIKDRDTEITVCKIWLGSPYPNITVTKDGKAVRENINGSSISKDILYESHQIQDDLNEICNGILITIHFSQVTHDMAGV